MHFSKNIKMNIVIATDIKIPEGFQFSMCKINIFFTQNYVYGSFQVLENANASFVRRWTDLKIGNLSVILQLALKVIVVTSMQILLTRMPLLSVIIKLGNAVSHRALCDSTKTAFWFLRKVIIQMFHVSYYESALFFQKNKAITIIVLHFCIYMHWHAQGSNFQVTSCQESIYWTDMVISVLI